MSSIENRHKFKSSRLAEILEKVVRIVPGVGHYQDKEKIRHWDKELRLLIVQKLEDVRREVEEVTRDLAEAGKIKPLKKLNDINNKLDRVRDTIKFASYGYAGIFDPRKIREAELLRHYEFDLQIAQSAEDISTTVGALKEAADARLDVDVPAKNLIKEIEGLERSFKQRNEFIIAEKPLPQMDDIEK